LDDEKEAHVPVNAGCAMELYGAWNVIGARRSPAPWWKLVDKDLKPTCLCGGNWQLSTQSNFGFSPAKGPPALQHPSAPTATRNSFLKSVVTVQSGSARTAQSHLQSSSVPRVRVCLRSCSSPPWIHLLSFDASARPQRPQPIDQRHLVGSGTLMGAPSQRSCCDWQNSGSISG